MDKETLSNYGWIVICVLVLAVMIALATPFGKYIETAVKSTTQGLFDVNQKALNQTNLIPGGIPDQEFDTPNENNTEKSYISHAGIIPEGAVYKRFNGYYNEDADDYVYDEVIEYVAGQEFPTPCIDDVYVYGNYEYCYGCTWCIDYQEWSSFCGCGGNGYTGVDGWYVRCVNDVPVPGDILGSINGVPTISLFHTFYGCTSVTTVTSIPNTVVDMYQTFYGCTSLKTINNIPEGIVDMNSMFYDCASLTTIPTIPEGVTDMNSAFYGCTSLTTVPTIPKGVGDMQSMFYGCTSLTGTITIDADVSLQACDCCFLDIDFEAQNITLKGASQYLDTYGKTGENYCVDCNGKCNEGH